MSRLFYGSLMAFALVASPSIAADTATASSECLSKQACSKEACPEFECCPKAACAKTECSAKELCAKTECSAKAACAKTECSAKELCAKTECSAKELCAKTECSAKEACVKTECCSKAACTETECNAKELCAKTECSAKEACAETECSSKVVGLSGGDDIGAFYVTKISGAADDGVDQGQELCYRCRYGSRPMVLVFARDTGGDMPEFLKQLDSAVVKHEDAKLKGLVTLLGDNSNSLKENGEKLAKSSSATHVPVVVAKEMETGPENYKLSPAAVITVVVANDNKVLSSRTFAADQIDVRGIMSDVTKMLN